MRSILITTGIFPPDIGGPASYGKILAEKLSKDFRVTLITYSSKLNWAEDKKLSFKVVRVWRKIPKFLRHLVYFFQVVSLAKKQDVIFALNSVSAGVPGLLAAKMRKKKFFVKVVGDYAWEIAVNKRKTSLLMNDFQKSKRKGWIGVLHKIQSWLTKNADGVIVPSEYLGRVVRGWGVSQNKIHVVYNQVEFKKSELTKEEARKKIDISGNIIVSIGRLVPWKGFRMLIKIMPELLKINQFFRLVIIGDGPEKSNLDSMVKNMRLEKKVYIVGRKSQSEVADYLAASDIFVLNTGYEGFSHLILEVMTAGVPVVTTTVGGNKEIIHQGENGFMVKYNDEFNLIEAIKTVWQVPEMRQRFIDGGLKASGLFSVDSMFQETVKVLKS
ncbi:MAG: hypothetical protein A3B99_04395 [Candidatus Yanofskybacteria bacterium RIFCSPHIGHO2_02_FULL_44_12b]|uniref:Glycosyltransferase subfamily 4-like N-terminal domain-containing protein n=2 Tax=Candidatus Yanofskyibacteriota TaxID=1752733 RepID=A0A1F8GJS6_9BACT|nr:MAG: Glycosyltransferase [Candidatus Yanofskybacteria bacterium GW2011_GWA2_44_9]OGN04581.1 MAG: hypothetical protein A2659_00445 [Candidatus Yanofskybacteria bacterium RIFCSPHIGHO2_01_FULL_44_24]OGN15753.1 MAG: hypothetical protein A3B99_04395 [Candidatus Yanofskybacteria bacterium RIFCSPHIGHO2_02_FULL_44_12b]OGN25652.1 MAG: hypothetical protein A2925_01860 [Candidatus Yanofskybacteria bacterium RIFCSPLOWO2_01_FULL_44_22]